MTITNVQLEQDLLDNALDFIRRAIEELRVTSSPLERDVKYSAVFMASGIELLLKARLVREHWSQVFEDPAHASLSKFNSGKFQSVGAKESVTRLKTVVGLEFDANPAEKVFDLRNRVIHFAPSSTASARIIIASGLSFVATFLEEQLKPHLLTTAIPAVEATQELINSAYSDLKDLAEKRMGQLKGILGTKPVVVECPACFQFAFVLSSEGTEELKCLFCYFTAPPEESAEEYASMVLSASRYESLKHGGDFPIVECIECMLDTMVAGVALARRPKVHYACFACAAVYEMGDLDECTRCGELMTASDSSICGECFTSLVGT